MIQYIEEQRTYKRTLAYICDVCKTTYDDELEMQEFQHINFIGGYNSVFGDGEQVVCDICQHCLKKMIGGFYRKEPAKLARIKLENNKTKENKV